ncbi:MAG: hypothetical protein IMX04_02600 [Candidatus Carbobacillus altaicus]|nr:hypothetical protein [Candidatus Carbobacillus altaicus]
MRFQQWFGVLFIAVGALALSNLWPISLPLATLFFSPESFLVIFGIVLFFFAWNRALELVLPALILIGIGIHALNVHFFHLWLDHWSIYAVIIGLAIILYGLFSSDGISVTWGAVLTLLAFLYEPLLSVLHRPAERFLSFWPLLLIVIGVFLLLKRAAPSASGKRRRR